MCAAWACEADAARASEESEVFVRAFAYTPHDAAVLVHQEDLSGLPNDPTDRFCTLIEQMGDSNRRILVLLDLKSFGWGADYSAWAHTSVTYKAWSAKIILKLEQAKRCEALIITNMGDPDWVAFLPRAYFRLPNMLENLQSDVRMIYGRVHVSVAQMSPLPPTLPHCVMRKADLPRMLDNFS